MPISTSALLLVLALELIVLAALAVAWRSGFADERKWKRGGRLAKYGYLNTRQPKAIFICLGISIFGVYERN